MVNTALVRDIIKDPERSPRELTDAIAKGHISYGTQTFDQSLMMLFRRNLITYEEALRQATNPDDFALQVSGISSTSDARWDEFDKPAEPAAAGKRSPQAWGRTADGHAGAAGRAAGEDALSARGEGGRRARRRASRARQRG
jgi:twitching motility protein PilT